MTRTSRTPTALCHAVLVLMLAAALYACGDTPARASTQQDTPAPTTPANTAKPTDATSTARPTPKPTDTTPTLERAADAAQATGTATTDATETTGTTGTATTATTDTTTDATTATTDATAGTAPPNTLAVKRLLVAAGVEDREPVGAADAFTTGALTRLLAFIELDNPEKLETEVSVAWLDTDSGRERGAYTLRVGPHARFRTWAHAAAPKTPGSWALLLRDADGHELARTPFTMR